MWTKLLFILILFIYIFFFSWLLYLYLFLSVSWTQKQIEGEEVQKQDSFKDATTWIHMEVLIYEVHELYHLMHKLIGLLEEFFMQ